MNIEPAKLPGAFRFRPAVRSDSRGSFVKTFQAGRFAKLGLPAKFDEDFFNRSKRGVLRGLHFQTPPHAQGKLVCCLEGRIFDALVDLRLGSPTYGLCETFELDGSVCAGVYVPEGVAHGFFVRSETAVVYYKVTREYAPEHDTGVHWASAGVPWPERKPLVSERDARLPPLKDFKSPFA